MCKALHGKPRSQAATQSKLAKVALVAAYLVSLSQEELPVATRFLTGQLLPPWGELALGIGHAAVRNVACRLAGCSHGQFARVLLRQGDLGEACQEVLEGRLPPPSSLPLLEVQSSFQDIARARGTGKKEALLEALLSRSSPRQAKLVAKIITSDLRMGLVEGLVEEAIARMGGVPLEEARRLTKRTG